MTPASPSVGVLALQGDVREHLVALRASGVEATGVRRRSELDAVDADDQAAAAALMKRAQVDAETRALVLKKMAEADSEH